MPTWGPPISTTPVGGSDPLPQPSLLPPLPCLLLFEHSAQTSPACLFPLSTEDFEGENPQVPKLEKSISGTSPKREHLPLAVGIAFFLMTLLAS